MADERWLIVGLGNPEGEYGGTRHNVGADLIRVLAARHRSALSRNKKAQCDVAEVRDAGTRLVLAVPSGYMNTSGGPTQLAANYYKVAPANLVVVHDESDLDVGAMRLKTGGSSSHNGIRDIVQRLGTLEFHRLRIGVGRPPGRMALKDHVLRPFPAAERDIIDVTLEHGADAILSLITDGLEPTQNRYH